MHNIYYMIIGDDFMRVMLINAYIIIFERTHKKLVKIAASTEKE